MPNRKKVAIIMGSDSDWPVVKSACGVLKDCLLYTSPSPRDS